MAKIRKDLKYLNRDFGTFRQNLIDFTKNYYPHTYNDFNESSPGMMFLEMASYVGDVLSFYTDTQFKENLIQYATERKNINNIANVLGYHPKNMVGAQVDLDVFQLVPAQGSGNNVSPDFNYAMVVDAGMVLESSTVDDVKFSTDELIDFSFSSSIDKTKVIVYQINDTTKEPEFYLLIKSVKSSSGEIKSTTFSFGEPKIYDKILIEDDDVIDIVDITDSDGNLWYEVPYLAQDTILESVQNIASNDPDLYTSRDMAPYLLKLKKVSRRYIKRLRGDKKFEIQFGSGISSDVDEDLVPTPELLSKKVLSIDTGVDMSLDPTNFLYTSTYGLAPSSVTLTVRYRIGKGIVDNLPVNDITVIASSTTTFTGQGLDGSTKTTIQNSLACNNPDSAFGGRSEETIDEIKQQSLSNFSTQNRTVTKEDYIVRTYSMPAKYGSLAKSFLLQDDQLNPNSTERIENPLALNLYTLGYDRDKKLITLNNAIKENLRNYLSINRMVTDAVNIKDAYIINIGIEFEIITLPEYNSNEVLIKCIDKLKSLFNIDKWQINQPIFKSKMYTELNLIQGIQSVVNLEIVNYYDEDSGYSGNIYDIGSATKHGITFPSKDPSIFEIKYPDANIRGKVVSY